MSASLLTVRFEPRETAKRSMVRPAYVTLNWLNGDVQQALTALETMQAPALTGSTDSTFQTITTHAGYGAW